MIDNSKPIMVYCVKCKAKKNIVEAEEVTMKNGKKAIKGKCSDCGRGVYCIISTAEK